MPSPRPLSQVWEREKSIFIRGEERSSDWLCSFSVDSVVPILLLTLPASRDSGNNRRRVARPSAERANSSVGANLLKKTNSCRAGNWKQGGEAQRKSVMRTWGGMAGFRRIGLCGATLLVSAAARGGDFNLTPYHNKNRLVFLFAPNKSNALYRKQAALWQGKRAEMDERDILRFNVFESGAGEIGAAPLSAGGSGALRKRFKIRRGAFRMILVGKDGHTALSSAVPVPAARLFALIDAMPMRRQEMIERDREQGTKQ